MPNQCVRCGIVYKDDAPELLKGCNCGSKFFFYIKKKDLDEAKKITTSLTDKEKVQIEKDVFDIVGESIEDSKPVILDLESIRLRKPGQYDIDLIKLFDGKPLVYKVGNGKYLIDIISSFKKVKKK